MIKFLITLLTVLFLHFSMNAQQNNDSIKTALLIIDIQNFYFPGDGPGLENVEQASMVAKDILRTFRDNNQLVVHVRHKANEGFDIHNNVEPTEEEKVITKEEINSFNKTDLLKYLNTNEVDRLVIIGMQTHMCLEAATRAAYDYGFECIVIHDACATRDMKFGEKVIKADDVHASTLATIVAGGYAKVITKETFTESINHYLFEKTE